MSLTKQSREDLLGLLKSEDFAVTTENVEEIMFILNEKKKINVRVPWIKENEIEVGKRYWYVKNINMMIASIELLTITHIRSGIVFFTSDKFPDVEEYFPLGCFMSSRLEPEIYVTKSNPKYFNYVSFSEKVKIEYVKNC